MFQNLFKNKLSVPLIFVLIIGVLFVIYSYNTDKYQYNGISQMTTGMNSAYSDDFTPDTNPDYDQQSPFTNNETNNVDSYASASGIQSSIIQPPLDYKPYTAIQDPSELLPRSEGSSHLTKCQ